MKRIIIFIFTLSLLFSLTACGNARQTEQAPNPKTDSDTVSLSGNELKSENDADAQIQIQTNDDQTIENVAEEKTENTFEDENNDTESDTPNCSSGETFSDYLSESSAVSGTSDRSTENPPVTVQPVQSETNPIETQPPQTDTPSQSDEGSQSETQPDDEKEETEYMMNIQIGENLLTATLVRSSSTEALLETLSNGPITINMRDYANMEKVGTLPVDLPRNDEPINTDACDLILYQGNSFVIYYDTNSWSLTRLGRIDNITKSELKSILGTGDVTVTLSLPE